MRELPNCRLEGELFSELLNCWLEGELLRELLNFLRLLEGGPLLIVEAIQNHL